MPPNAKLPTELLYEVIAAAVVRYVDEILAGPLKYDGSPSSTGPSRKDAALLAMVHNPFPTLLQASYQVRHITLLVLSQILGVTLESSGVGSLQACPIECLHELRLLIWKAENANEPAYKAFTKSKYNVSEVLCCYTLTADLRVMTALILSPLKSPAGEADEQLLEMFAFTRDMYKELSKTKSICRIPETLLEFAVERFQCISVDFFTSVAFDLILSLKQLRVIKDCFGFRGGVLGSAYDATIHNIGILEGVMSDLCDLEEIRPTRRKQVAFETLHRSTLDTCAEMCKLVPSDNAFVEQHDNLQHKARGLQEAICSHRRLKKKTTYSHNALEYRDGI